jgi:hypothetical protein
VLTSQLSLARATSPASGWETCLAMKLHVANNAVHRQQVPGGVRVGWQLKVLGESSMDIEAGVYFLGDDKAETEVTAPSRVSESSGSYMTPAPGHLVFVLDNSYSMFNEKDVEVTVMLPGGGAADDVGASAAPAPTRVAAAVTREASALSLPPAVAVAGYTLYYWEGFSGRVEAPILLLEDAGVKYTVNRDVKGFLYKGGNQAEPCFACPVLVDSGFALAQTTAIMEYLGRQHGYITADPREQACALQLCCTAADIWSEAYAAKKSGDSATQATFLQKRMAQWLAHLSDVLCHPPSSAFFGGPQPSCESAGTMPIQL